MNRLLAVVVALVSLPLAAAKIDMKQDRRAVATDDGIRIDAQLEKDYVTPHVPIGVTYQIENATSHAIAVAEKVCDASYDIESHTITLSVGAEVPAGGVMPRVVVIAPGEKRTLKAGASFSGPAVPRFVQIRINVLRDVALFASVPERETLTDAQFDRWIETNEAIELNVLPVSYRPNILPRDADASRR